MKKYNWKIICQGFGTEYKGEVDANSNEEAQEKIIELHEKGYNHYSYEIFINSKEEQKEINCKVVCGKIVNK